MYEIQFVPKILFRNIHNIIIRIKLITSSINTLNTFERSKTCREALASASLNSRYWYIGITIIINSLLMHVLETTYINLYFLILMLMHPLCCHAD